MKRIVICFDGTWNRIDAEEPTNVLMLATGVAPITSRGTSQIVHYDEGVGTEGSKVRRLVDGGFGFGVLQNLSEAYRFLMFNYEPHDDVYVFGFSRGAFTARSFVGLVRSIGIIQRYHIGKVNEGIRLYRKRKGFAHPDLLDFRARYSGHVSTCGEDETHRCNTVEGYQPGSSLPFKFRYVGLWDTVESLGLGNLAKSTFKNRKDKSFTDSDYDYHDHRLSGIVVAGRHAVALDERRRYFHSEPWGDLQKANARLGYGPNDPDRPIQEQFFPGDHGSVGGGGDIRGLSDGAFAWVLDGAKQAGLVLDASPSSAVYSIFPDFRAPLRNTSAPPKKVSVMNMRKRDRAHAPGGLHQVHESAQRRWVLRGENGPYRPANLASLSATLDVLRFDAPYHVKAERGLRDERRGGGDYMFYTIIKGDTLGSVAETFMGSAARWKELHTMNAGTVPDPDKVYVGQVIRVPRPDTDP
ncbi:MAG: DUF2235 domain-containing protein [Pseudomonadota bacterium]